MTGRSGRAGLPRSAQAVEEARADSLTLAEIEQALDDFLPGIQPDDIIRAEGGVSHRGLPLLPSQLSERGDCPSLFQARPLGHGPSGLPELALPVEVGRDAEADNP